MHKFDERLLLRCKNEKRPTFIFGKLHIWEIAHLGKYLWEVAAWEKAFWKVPNIKKEDPTCFTNKAERSAFSEPDNKALIVSYKSLKTSC